MTRAIHLHGMLGRRFGRLHRLDVSSPKEAVRALHAVLGPQFTKALRNGTWNVVAGPRVKNGLDCAELLGMSLGRQDLHFVPAARGSGGKGIFQAVLGAVLLTAALVFAPEVVTLYGPGMADVAAGGLGATAFSIGGMAVTYGSIAMTGGMMVLSGMSSLLAGTPRLGSYSSLESSDSQTSMLFNGPVLTVEQGGPVPVVYGKMRVSGCLVSSGTTVEQLEAEGTATLRSKAIARLAIAVSEGEVGGPVDGAKSISFGDTPLMADNGSYNFEGVSYTFRTGTSDQEYVPGFSETENETSVNVTATFDAPVVRRMADGCDASRVIVAWPAGLYTVGSSIGKGSVRIAIDSRLESGEWATIIDETVEGKTLSAYQRAYRVERPGTGDWDLRLRRVTADRDLDTYRDTVEWDSYVEIQDSKVAYADTAIIFLELDSELFGSSLPTPSVEIYGIKVRVPSNYDPETREYTGEWDGTFKAAKAWTDNAVWCEYDLATHRRYGCGRFGLTDDNVDKWSAYTAAQYADGLVDDGYGGQEARFRVGCCINARAGVYNVLTTFASVWRGMFSWSSDLAQWHPDMPQDPTHVVNQATCVDGIQHRKGMSLQALFSVYTGTWNDPSYGYKLRPEVHDDPVLLARHGWRQTDAVLWGVPSRGQARRALKWAAYTDNYEGEVFTFTGGLDFADYGVGQAAVNHDPSVAGAALGGKIVAADTTSLTLDREVVLAEGDPGPVYVVLPDKTAAQAEVASVSSSTHRGRAVSVLNLASALAAAPLAWSNWVLRTTAVAPQILRCMGNKEADKHLHEITARLSYPEKYDLIEQGILFEPDPVSAEPTGPLPVPANVTATEIVIQRGSALIPAVAVSWTPATDRRVGFAQVQMRAPGMTLWEDAGTTSQASLDVEGLDSGEHAFRVRFLTRAGQVGPWATLGDQYVLGMLQPLPDVEDVGFRYVNGLPRIYWSGITDLRKFQYEVRRGLSWSSSARVALTTATEISTVGTGTYWVKARYLTAYSENAASIVIAGDDLPVNAVASRDEAAEGWDGTLGGDLEISGGNVVLPGGSESASYSIAESSRVLLAANAMCAVTCDILAYAEKDGEDLYSVADVYAEADVYGADSQYIDATVQMRLHKDGDWGEWQDFTAGQYFAAGFDFRVTLSTQRADTAAVLSGFAWTVDAPDRTWSAQDLAVPDTGASVSFDPAFAVTPALVVQVPAGQVAVISDKSATGFTLTITEGGTAVASAADAIAKGY